jgi:hypothetical protein
LYRCRPYIAIPHAETFAGFWTTADVRAAPRKLFLFGDNDAPREHGGQAVIRPERKKDTIAGKRVARRRRVSVTFRSLR